MKDVDTDEINEIKAQEGQFDPEPPKRKEWTIYPASPKVLAKCDPDKVGFGVASRNKRKPQAKYPFGELLVGECFILGFVELEPTTLANLRGAASNAGKRLVRKFVVVVHKEHKCVEVARIA